MVLPWHMPLQTCCIAPHITPDDDDDTELVLPDEVVPDDVVLAEVVPTEVDCDVLDDVVEPDWVELLLPVDDVPPVPPDPPSPMDDP